ncbi:MAG: hypothetical protein JWR33_58 [Naasia sp.]|jgi:hypothetical protein|uniref:Pr6Pr family membrane protein n=1 Tax=Naasia sp. TaxID=2546198 RepID=UPI0026350CA8|nr:Pr6Pr family membrane protein [Naasia sp.]MCU1569317.1 hypothetical protein [Naasia sp.]
MAWRTAMGSARLLAAAAGIVALVARFLYGLGFPSFGSANYFAYLTMQSNIAAVVVSAVAGIRLLRGVPETRALSTARALVASFLIVAGFVFALLASQAPAQGYRLDVPWSDQVLHFYLPAFALADWLITPGRRPVRWRALVGALGYPTVWGIGTILRGQLVGWYPYFFLDPRLPGYPLSFLAYSAGALALFVAVAAGLIAASRTSPLGQRELPRRRHGADHGPTLLGLALLLLSRPARRVRGSRARRP